MEYTHVFVQQVRCPIEACYYVRFSKEVYKLKIYFYNKDNAADIKDSAADIIGIKST